VVGLEIDTRMEAHGDLDERETDVKVNSPWSPPWLSLPVRLFSARYRDRRLRRAGR
jgi:hypothetical protein